MALCGGVVAVGSCNVAQYRVPPSEAFTCAPVGLAIQQSRHRTRALLPESFRVCHVCRDAVTQPSVPSRLRHFPPVASAQRPPFLKIRRFHFPQGQQTKQRRVSLRTTTHRFYPSGRNLGNGCQLVVCAATVPAAAAKTAVRVSLVERFSEWLAKKLVASPAVATLPFNPRVSVVAVILREIFVLIILQVALHQVEPAMRGANEVWSKYLRRDDEVTEEEFQASGFRALVEPFNASVLLMVTTHWLRIFSPMIGIYISRGSIAAVRKIGLVVSLVWFLLKWKQKVVESVVDEDMSRSPQITLVDKLTSIVLVLTGAIIGAETLGFQLKTLFALGGLSGIAIGLATKDLMSNLFAGAVLYATRPFVIGDKISVKNDINGVVKDIGFYQTRLINSENLPITVPNSMLMSVVIVNFTRAKSRSMSGTFHLRHEDIMRIDEISKKIERMVQEHSFTTGSPRVTLGSLNMFGLELRLSCEIKSAQNNIFYRKQHEILVRAADIIHECGGKLVSLTEIPGFYSSGMAGNGALPSSAQINLSPRKPS